MTTDRLTELRREVDRVDASIVAALAARRLAVSKLAAHKREVDLPALDPDREAEVRAAWLAAAAGEGLPAELALAVLEVILTESRAQVMACVGLSSPEG
jgi:chorismate mutase